MSHSPTPWRVHCTLEDEDAEPTIEVREAPYGHRDAVASVYTSEEDADYIATCVNAHETLVSALRQIADSKDAHPSAGWALKIARAALAEVSP